VSPEFREYERASTTAIDAYLGPALSDYLDALAHRVSAAGLPEPLVMRSSGGVATLGEAAAHPSVALVSGPAAGVVGASLIARRAGYEQAISFDMGGTSTDVCLIADGRAEIAAERTVAGLPLRLPSVDLHTVGAGGGSVVWTDRGGALRVGPESAGADPGPASYGRGGERPTVTDANLLLDRLPERLAAGLELDREAAAAALADLDPAAVVEIVNAEMYVSHVAPPSSEYAMWSTPEPPVSEAVAESVIVPRFGVPGSFIVADGFCVSTFRTFVVVYVATFPTASVTT
jgi:N-methylhydantoinase A